MHRPLETKSFRILIVDDNRDICENIGDYLEAKGHIVDFAFDGISALHLVLTKTFDVVVLDLMLPGMDGLTVCQKIRNETDKEIQIIMLTAKDTLPEKIEGFEAGADDYLVKPFALQELYARILAITKRGHSSTAPLLIVGDLTLNKHTLEVKRAGQTLILNPICLRILSHLMDASPSVVTREDLEVLLWGDKRPDSDALRTHLYKLRQIIDKPFSRPLLHTVHRLGYRLAEIEENVSE